MFSHKLHKETKQRIITNRKFRELISKWKRASQICRATQISVFHNLRGLWCWRRSWWRFNSSGTSRRVDWQIFTDVSKNRDFPVFRLSSASRLDLDPSEDKVITPFRKVCKLFTIRREVTSQKNYFFTSKLVYSTHPSVFYCRLPRKWFCLNTL